MQKNKIERKSIQKNDKNTNKPTKPYDLDYENEINQQKAN